MSDAVSDSFNLADSDTASQTVDALNISFNSISEMCDEYTNYSTTQEFAILTIVGYVDEGTTVEIYTGACEGVVNVWGINLNYSSEGYSMVGTLTGSTFTSYTSGYITVSQPYRLAK